MFRFCRNHKLELLPGISHWVQQEAHEAVTKPLILFLHGFPEFWYSWRHQIKYFQKVL